MSRVGIRHLALGIREEENPQSLTPFHQRLHAWYASHGRRDLPWRKTDDPYHIYLSEIMLQQTQVKTVLERFYFPFLERFPTLQSLAEAELSDVLSLWQGLGYYTRAANLHKAARIAAPSLPREVEGLRALPGIGRNTAHAVAAFAYRAPVPVMEANVKRILHRIFALPTASEAELWERAELLLDRANPFDYNQAMMDIGAGICTPAKPACALCPAAVICRGKDAPLDYPVKKARKQTPVRHRAIILFVDRDGRYFTRPRTARFLHGLYGFVEVEAEEKSVMFEGRRYALSKAEYLGDIRQVYSHFTLDGRVYRVPVRAAKNSPEWKTVEELEKLPLSKADEKVIGLLKKAAM